MADAETDQGKPLVTHMIELRACLLRIVIATSLVLLVLLPFADQLYAYIAIPLMSKLPVNSTMIATEVASPFFAPFKLTLFCAFFVTMPYSIYQIWKFIAPGLYKKEQKLAVPLVLSSILLFYIGIIFAYFIVFPVLFAFLVEITPDNVQMMTDINHYLNFILKLFFAFGLSFEIPIAIFLLVQTELVTVEQLATNRPYVILLAFIAGMLLTPPDVISQILLAIPMWLLFESGLIISRLCRAKTAPKANHENANH